jgi:hypothetical protein
VGIPALYVNTGLVLSESLEGLGDRANAAKVMTDTEGVARATHIDEFFSFVNQRSTLPLPGLTVYGGERDRCREER